MLNQELQAGLKTAGLYEGEIDGKIGRLTRAAIDKLLQSEGVPGWESWGLERRELGAKQIFYRKVGIDSGPTDGLIGPATRFAQDVWEARKRERKIPSSEEVWRDKDIDVPAPKDTIPRSAVLWPRQKDVNAFYGHVGSNQVQITPPYTLRIAWNLNQTAKKISVHKKVAENVERVLDAVLKHYGIDEIKKLRLDLFGGSLNVRKMRGGSSWSMHSWGIALDFDPERNQLKWGKDRAEFAKPEYDFWNKAWEAQGAIGLGRARNYDWMHYQFARL